MSGLFSLQNINRQGLMANQRALSVTGQNVANVNTPGYSRRQTIFAENRVGGVKVLGVQRIRDEFLDVQLRSSNARLGGHRVSAQNLQLLETALNESDDSGISPAFKDFFAALQDLTLQPSGTTEREVVRSNAELLQSAIHGATSRIRDNRRQVDLQVRQEVDKLNQLTQSLAQVNHQLGEISPDLDSNSLADQRDQLIEQIAEIVPIRAIEDARGVSTVFLEGGATLVEAGRSYELMAQSDPSNDGYAQVGLKTITGGLIPIADRLTEGSLGALLRVRDVDGKQLLNRIERMSAELIRAFNAQHRAGTGLDGVSGRDFFTGLAATASAGFGNSGQASASSAVITDESLLTFDDYQIKFTAPGTYDVIDTTTGTTLSSGNAYSSGSAITFAGISLVIADGATGPAAGDVFSVNTYSGTADRLDLSAAVKAGTAAIAAGNTSAPGDNQNALALAALRDATRLEGGTQTFEQYYSNTRVNLGIAVDAENRLFGDEEISQRQISELASAARAVSVDEESVNLIQYQRAFEASSRMISITDQLLETVVNLTR